MLIASYSQIHYRIQNVRGFSLSELHPSLMQSPSSFLNLEFLVALDQGGLVPSPLLRPIRVYLGQETHRTEVSTVETVRHWLNFFSVFCIMLDANMYTLNFNDTTLARVTALQILNVSHEERGSSVISSPDTVQIRLERHQARPVNSPLPGFSVLQIKSAVKRKKILAPRIFIYSLLMEDNLVTVTFRELFSGNLDFQRFRNLVRHSVVIFIFVNERRRPPPASIPARLTPEADEDSSVPEMVNGPKTSQITARRARTFLRY
ncbi:hypothetical protein EV368DRAFT_63855 [Lentinula lateritia]|uniref:Uncharacterized protein n=1 Tax=Lentinula aff. lateritia TaxID=2804960 RepID=A0ACC1U9S4_9AGAR|nr:hypothetical protein F5876DRAFT_62803 [Lentinula aff. lateritia]KAJ3853731.1 hypothetical protein EV368DRAFT_63855 [Lentinula lateritia]